MPKTRMKEVHHAMHSESSYSLIRADPRLYASYFATYRKNIWFRPSWSAVQAMMSDAEDCYWVMQANRRVAGITLSAHTLGSCFVLPPFGFSDALAAFLRDACLRISGDSGRIEAFNVLPDQLDSFENAGFVKQSARKCMLRPTERLSSRELADFCCVRPDERTHSASIVRLKHAAFRGGPDEQELRACEQDVRSYFEHHHQGLLEASSLLIHRESNEAAGYCLISMWEDLPLVYDIGVHPEFQRNGLGAYMLTEAIRKLEPYYPVLRLFVTSGNPAEHAYANLGFLSGDAYAHLVYHRESWRETIQ